MSWNPKSKPAFLSSYRCQSGYVPGPKEAWLKTQVVIITADWPDESRMNLIEAVVEALDEARAVGVASARELAACRS